jgi:hypothetical protein
MRARLDTYSVDSNRFDEAFAYLQSELVAKFCSASSSSGSLVLRDCPTGRFTVISLWASDTALEAFEETAQRIPEEIRRALRVDASVACEDFEVVELNLPGQQGDYPRVGRSAMQGGDVVHYVGQLLEDRYRRREH